MLGVHFGKIGFIIAVRLVHGKSLAQVPTFEVVSLRPLVVALQL